MIKKLGDFDAYVQDEQEKSAHERYAAYLEWCEMTDTRPKSWADFWHDEERKGE